MKILRGILNFNRTAELGSFTAAARELDISPVAVSQNISSDALHPWGKLRATVVSPVAYLYLIPLLPLFFKRYPHIQPARVRVFVDFCVDHFGGHADLSADVAEFVV